MRRAALILLALLIAIPATAPAAPKKKAAAAPPAGSKIAANKKAALVTKGLPGRARKGAVQVARKGRAVPAARNAASVAPKPDAALVAAYAAMPVAERRALQNDLIWSGDYNGTVSDDFGERAIAAVKSYQARSAAEATGILSPEQRTALAATAKAKQEASGWRVVDDPVTGARLAIPIKHAPQSSAGKSGTRWSSARGEVQIETFRIAEPPMTLAAVFEQQKKEPANREVEYNVLRENFFVLAGQQGLKRFYVRAHGKDGEVRGFTILYDQAMQGIMDRVAVAMSSRFEPFPRGPAVPARRNVEYATGIVVDDLGHIVTDRQATDDCQVITLSGLGPAERIAAADNVALLRVYGARHLNPVALAEGGANGREVTLVGITDPQTQGGDGAATTLRTRVRPEDGNRLDPPPAQGFSGAAALDADGRLVGMALLRSTVIAGPTQSGASAQLVPIEEIRTLIADRRSPSGAAAPAQAAGKASVVRVICVRK